VRRRLLIGGSGFAAVLVGWFLIAPPTGRSSTPQIVWGKRGQMPGDVVRPRAAAIDPTGRLFLVDFTARVQAYDLDGKHLGVTFTTPDFRNGRPSGLGIDRDGNLLVADSHYHTVRVYSPDGTELKSFGIGGTGPGQFGYVSDCVQDADGFYYVSEFGQTDRITKVDLDGKFVRTWGKNGVEPGEFQRVRALAFGPDGNLYAADACNHRIQVFTKDGELVRVIGGPGAGPGQFSYPYDIAFGPDGEFYVSERGNQRVQKFDRDGNSVGVWGTGGRGPGQVADPWALAVDKSGRVHVVDTENHRVQRVRF
jgi:DNA-binding beta-propeller fold protein YncE